MLTPMHDGTRAPCNAASTERRSPGSAGRGASLELSEPSGLWEGTATPGQGTSPRGDGEKQQRWGYSIAPDDRLGPRMGQSPFWGSRTGQRRPAHCAGLGCASNFQPLTSSDVFPLKFLKSGKKAAVLPPTPHPAPTKPLARGGRQGTAGAGGTCSLGYF